MDRAIRDRWRQGWQLTGVAGGPDTLFATFTTARPCAETGFEYRYDLASFENAILARWNRGWRLISVQPPS
jgi:hypothetical protein